MTYLWRTRSSVPLIGISAVLFGRDDTLVRDHPRYNGDPGLVESIPGASQAVARLRENGLLVGVISNQSGIGRGYLTVGQVERVNARVDAMIGPFDTWRYCPHAPEDACACRKPAPGLVLRAAEDLGVAPGQIVVIGDIGTDVRAAEAAGAAGILVPSPRTLPDEVREAAIVATDLAEAVTLVLAGHHGGGRPR